VKENLMLVHKMTHLGVAEMIERHVNFYKEDGTGNRRSVAPPPGFVRYFMRRPEVNVAGPHPAPFEMAPPDKHHEHPRILLKAPAGRAEWAALVPIVEFAIASSKEEIPPQRDQDGHWTWKPGMVGWRSTLR
jgi:hypothetical protein